MDQDDERLKKELVRREEALLENAVRNDATKLATLILDGCIEFSAAGKQRVFKSGELFENLDGELYIVSNTVKLKRLADDCVLLVYAAGKVTKNSRIKSNRSSIWRQSDGQWKLAFHQGTNCAD